MHAITASVSVEAYPKMTDITSPNLDRLRQIMRQLRDPETGCPWDIKQDFKSIAPYTLEEAYEVVDAINQGQPEKICDELGDLLLQVVFHAQMADEQNLFDFDDVARAVSDKMERRHPHIFADVSVSGADDVKRNWEDIKAEERRLASPDDRAESLLDDIPVSLPAMNVAVKYQKRAARVGFDWPDMAGVIDKLREEITECEDALHQTPVNKEHVKEEIGDLLFAAANLARKAGVDPETALLDCNRKFSFRFRYIEEQFNHSHEDMKAASLAELDELWNEAKAAEKA